MSDIKFEIGDIVDYAIIQGQEFVIVGFTYGRLDDRDVILEKLKGGRSGKKQYNALSRFIRYNKTYLRDKKLKELGI